MPARWLLSAAALIVGASAFLIPPEIDTTIIPEDSSDISALDILPLTYQTLELPCPECPFLGQGGDGKVREYSDAVENHLVLNFTLRDNELEINGVSLNVETLFFAEPIYAVQESTSGEVTEPLPLGYLIMYPVPIVDEESKNEVMDVHFKILALDGIPVNPDMILIHLLKTRKGKVILAQYETRPASNDDDWMSPTEELDDGVAKDCSTQLCKAKAIMAAKLQEMMDHFSHIKDSVASHFHGCHGSKGSKHPHHHHDATHDEAKESHSGHGHPPMINPGMHHPMHVHHFHGNSKFTPIMRTALLFVGAALASLLIGIVAGIFVRFLGVLVGLAIIAAWHRFRGGRGEYRRVDEEEERVGAAEFCEKEAVEEPPKYEELEGTMPSEKQ